MIEIVLPMAGLGSRFMQAGYELPKPLIPIHGVPMISLVIDNLRPTEPHRFTFVLQEQVAAAFDLETRLHSWAPGCLIKRVSHLTDGPASTVLLGLDGLLPSAPLLVANCDQFVDASIDEFLVRAGGLDGLIMTMTDDDPKWSFVRTDEEGFVTNVAEKVPISNQATVGIYYFRSVATFSERAREMIDADDRVNGEFYVAPVYNRMISTGAAVRTFPVGEPNKGMHGLGVPADLERFLKDPISKFATDRVRHASD